MSEEIAGLGCGYFDVEVDDVDGYGGVFVGSADACVVEAAVVAECDGACFVDAVVSLGCISLRATVSEFLYATLGGFGGFRKGGCARWVLNKEVTRSF